MANLIIICGPQAVGKMTVAESLGDKLKYNLMMNHDSIEISDQIFGFGTPAQRDFNQFFTSGATANFDRKTYGKLCDLQDEIRELTWLIKTMQHFEFSLDTNRLIVLTRDYQDRLNKFKTIAAEVA